MSDQITVSIEGGSPLSLASGVSVAEALGGSTEGALAALLDDVPVDLSHTLEADCRLSPVTGSCDEGLEIIRHSTAHLLAQAVKRLYPEAQVTIGPVISDGFYYDFAYRAGFTPEDLEAIGAEMKKIAAADLPVSRQTLARAEAAKVFREMGEDYKVEIIEGIGDDDVSLYRQGEFVDLCRGPHVPSTGRLGSFKLTHVAGAYWRGDEKNEMLQRIYGTAFGDDAALAAHLERLEEARKRDHRVLGKRLGLFSFHKEAPATPFFQPGGAWLYNRLTDYIRELYGRYGYDEVITPQVLDEDLWRRSGHYDNYRDNMYFTEVEGRSFAVKPMNCPTHCLMFSEQTRSYRDLPIRMADFGRLHRYERSGVVHGLIRVRSFSQDDAHIFCTPDQVREEVAAVVAMVDEAYGVFGFRERRIYLSTKPAKAIGDDATWETAETTLGEVLDGLDAAYTVKEGDGAFYGPEIAFRGPAAVGREWQLGTVQLDFSMPERLDLSYVDADGGSRRPVMIHRAVLGSIERFIGIFLEHTAGDLPMWLSPCQVLLVTVTEKQNEYAEGVAAALKDAGLRVRADLRNEKLGFKIREAQHAKVPVVAVIGDREKEAGTVAPRLRGGEQVDALPIDEFKRWALERGQNTDGGLS